MASTTTQLLQTVTTHSRSLIHGVDAIWSYFAETLASTIAWGPLCRIAQSNILGILAKFEIGEVEIVTENEKWAFGKPSAAHPGLKAVLHVKSETFWTRVALFTDLGLAEAYMLGDVDCDDITALLKIFILNRDHVKAVDSLAASILAASRSITSKKFRGSLSNSRANISSHYDLGTTMFRAFLSEDMNYSSAIFKDYNEDLHPEGKELESLEDAQLRKMQAILKQANIQPGDRVLEIGTGFGSLSILAAKSVQCTIETINLSLEQTLLARKRIDEAGLSDCITVYNMDFRDCMQRPEWMGSFDRFISVEMMEHVGKNYMVDFWRVADWALKPDTGVGIIQVITLPEARVPDYDNSVDFIQKWVLFPGLYIPSLTFLLESLRDASSGRLTPDAVYNIGPHYARTLREWKRKFLSNWTGVISKALIEKHQLGPAELEVFRRKWIYYFDYCEAGFATRTLGDHGITFTREGNASFGCGFEI